MTCTISLTRTRKHVLSPRRLWLRPMSKRSAFQRLVATPGLPLQQLKEPARPGPASPLGDRLREPAQEPERRVTVTAPPRRPAVTVPPLWQLIVSLLNVEMFDFTPEYLSDFLHISPAMIRHYCRQLWPDFPTTHYRLDFDQAAVLVHRVCRDSRKVPNAEELYMRMVKGEMIRADFAAFAATCPHIRRAVTAIQQYREQASKTRQAA